MQAFFEPDGAGGQRLYLHHPPSGPARAALVFVHAFAEEMNKSRRMAALAARALAGDGCAVLQVDLLGCGDSSGDFGDASWDAWVADVLRAADWLQQQHPRARLWLWGHRAGALVACEAASRHAAAAPDLLLWHPTPSGKAVLQQFLRLKAAAQLADGGGKAIMAQARAELAAGQPVDVAGYTLAPALAGGLEAALLTPPEAEAGSRRHMVWIEVGAGEQPSPAAGQALVAWQEASWQAHAQIVPGPAFWQTTEIEHAPALVEATRQTLATRQGAAESAPSA